MKKWLLAAIYLGAALLSGCGTEPPSASADVFAMDTYMTISTYGDRCEEALETAVTEIERLDALLSVGNADSEISRINADGSGTLSADTQIMVEQALEIWRTTGGAFDITVYPIMQAWGFTTGDYKVPSKSELQALLETARSEKLTLDGSELTLGSGQGIDLGGIAKGYTSDRLMEIFKAYDLKAGVVSLGGNVQCCGTKPDGSLWRCGIRDPNAPDDPNALLGVVSVADRAVITSGAYERILPTRTGGSTTISSIRPPEHRRTAAFAPSPLSALTAPWLTACPPPAMSWDWTSLSNTGSAMEKILTSSS